MNEHEWVSTYIIEMVESYQEVRWPRAIFDRDGIGGDELLTLKLKHYNSELEEWEEKVEFLTFRFVRIIENAVNFSGLTYFKRDDASLDA